MADYYKFKKNEVQKNMGYQPGKFGKIALWITVPAGLISLGSVVVAFFNIPEAFIVSFITLGITVIGCICISIDIIIFNRKQKKKYGDEKTNSVKTMDIGRMVHLLLGVVVGIIIGYLIWGMNK